jgi:pseudouridine 5'-phosphatase
MISITTTTNERGCDCIAQMMYSSIRDTCTGIDYRQLCAYVIATVASNTHRIAILLIMVFQAAFLSLLLNSDYNYHPIPSLSFLSSASVGYLASAARKGQRNSNQTPGMADPPAGGQEEFSQRRAPVKAILFDLDGTLLDTETLSDRAMYAALGLDCPDDVRLPWQLKKHILGKRGTEWAPIVLEYYAARHWPARSSSRPWPDALTLFDQWEDHLSNYCREVQACAGATELVDRLASLRVPMAIATSSRTSAVSKKRSRHEEMFRNFPIIVCGDHPAVKVGKPAPDIYIEAARQLGVDVKDCLVFEDALSGVRAGVAAGCRVVAIPDNRFDESERAVFAEEADVVLDSLLQFDGGPFGLAIDMNRSSNI